MRTEYGGWERGSQKYLVTSQKVVLNIIESNQHTTIAANISQSSGPRPTRAFVRAQNRRITNMRAAVVVVTHATIPRAFTEWRCASMAGSGVSTMGILLLVKALGSKSGSVNGASLAFKNRAVKVPGKSARVLRSGVSLHDGVC